MFGGAQTDPVAPKKPVEEALVAMPQDADFDFIDASEPDGAEPAVSPDGNIANRRVNKWEKRKRTIEIVFDGIALSLEAETYDYDYPEKIQQETGILGYERTKISNQGITDFIKKYYSEKHGINVEEYGFESVESIKAFEEKHKERRKSRPRTEEGFYTEEYQYSEQYKTDELLSEISYGPLKEIIHSMSNGEYPTRCFNHIFSAYVHDEKLKDAYHNEFKQSKFFLQKIYNTESRKRLGEGSLRHKLGNYFSTEKVLDKSDNTVRPHREKDEYFEGTKDLERDNKWAFTELNFWTSDFWYATKKINGVCFGFSMKDGLLKEYLEESLRCLSDIKDDNYYSSPLTVAWFDSSNDTLNGTISIIWNLAFLNEKIQDLLFEDRQESQVSVNALRMAVDTAFSEMEQRTTFPISEFLSSYDNDYIDEVNKYLDTKYKDNGFNHFKASLVQRILGTRKKILKNEHSNDAHIHDEGHIPIFINHDELPQLSWGHAKYAHYMNEKGLNFFKFKHSEHLPAPERAG